MCAQPFQPVKKPSFWHRYTPFRPHEKSKFFMFCLLKGLLSFLFVLLKVQKKANIVIGESAEKIPATKTIVFFLSIVVATFYSAMSNRYRQEKLFYGILFIFLGCFLLHGLILAPYATSLSPTHAQQWLETYRKWPFFNNWLKTFVVLYLNWTKVFFYCLAELWGQFAIVLFFWGLAGDFFSRDEGKRFFHFFIAAGNLASIFSVLLGNYVVKYFEEKSLFSTQQKLATLSSWVAMTGACVVLILLFCYRWVNRNLYNSEEKVKVKQMKTKLSFAQSLRFVLSNAYLIAITLMIICCGIARSLVETTAEKYKGVAAQGQIGDYVDFETLQVILIHVFSILSAFFLVPSLLRKRGWKGLAYATPILELCVGGGLFLASMWWKVKVGEGCLVYIAYFSVLQGAIGTFSKYIFFDTSKEIVYTGIDFETRKKGKAADVVGSGGGKWLASWIHIVVMGFFSATEDVRKVTPILLGTFLVVTFIWLHSIRYLGKRLS